MPEVTPRDIAGTARINLQTALGYFVGGFTSEALDSLEVAYHDLEDLNSSHWWEDADAIDRMLAGEDEFDAEVIQHIIDHLTEMFML